ncbi:hypothetical protein M0812_16432 [Anaeramoeba flamelloides]|uniref:Uncharacterized protein n=1 Tax=Anaeramoeba flamelloides TaxID=1746091 RepID=A0AAV7Z8E4_9EUKA|nr:hypothetical protein M0812_16432 [Anaeramoeba flamelloides]
MRTLNKSNNTSNFSKRNHTNQSSFQYSSIKRNANSQMVRKRKNPPTKTTTTTTTTKQNILKKKRNNTHTSYSISNQINKLVKIHTNKKKTQKKNQKQKKTKQKKNFK